MSGQTTLAPDSKPYRTVSAAVDVVTGAPGTFLAIKKNGLNTLEHKQLHVEVIPDPANPGANPAVAVFFWSEKAGKFLPLSPTPITVVAQGVNVAHTFVIDCNGRHLAIAVTSGVAAGQKVFIATSAYGLNHTL